MTHPIRLGPDGIKHHRRCKCPDCAERLRLAQWRKTIPNDGSVCIGTTRCKCPECRLRKKREMQEYGQKNKKILREKAIARNAHRTEEIAAYQANYYRENKERIAEQSKNYREANAERIKAQRLEYREANRDKLNERQAQYYQDNKADRLAYAKQFRDEKMHPEYKIWDGMIQRCDNPNAPAYRDYGGRGIGYDPKWREFEGFFEDMGPRPSSEYSIERVDVQGNYCKANCIWLPMSEQQKNTRKSMKNKLAILDDALVGHNGQMISLKEFSAIHDLPLLIAKYRYCRHANEDWILGSEYDNRYYDYQGHRYNMTELSLLSGLPYAAIFNRIRKLNWSTDKAMETELRSFEK